MSDKDTKTYAFPLLNGNYKATGNWYSSIVVNGSKGVMKEPSGTPHAFDIIVGEFGEADPEIIKTTQQRFYNIEFTFEFGKVMKEVGVLSEDGMKITNKGFMGICTLEWMTEEEAKALEADGDPIEAPPCPYKIQPEYLGKLLWITGPPGLGKSTSAALLSQNAGFVYYEADCYSTCKNPYIPPDNPNPSMAQVNQRPLRGEGLSERKEICRRANEAVMKIVNGEDYDEEHIKQMYTGMAEDILRERKRIGGDWAIAAFIANRDMREHIRSILGPDLIFVVLTMDMDEIKTRVTTRHHGDESVFKMFEPVIKLCEPVGEDEKKAVTVRVTSEMSREDVLAKILEMVK